MPIAYHTNGFFKRLLSALLVLVGLSIVIAVHESGHFLMCKLFGISTPEFSIGFGPTIFSRQIGETKFKLSALPLGGYTAIAGVDQRSYYSSDPRLFANKAYWKKALILLAGIIFNIIFAYLLLLLFFAPGRTKPSTKIAKIVPDSAAEAAGLQPGETIISINGTTVENNPTQALQIIGSFSDTPIEIETRKEDSLMTHHLMPSDGKLGVILETQIEPSKGFFDAISSAIEQTNAFFLALLKSASSFLKRSKNTNNDLKILFQVREHQGFMQNLSIFIFSLAFISINLAVVNLLPIPALDGGQFLIVTLESMMGKPIPDTVRMVLNLVSWALIIGLMFYFSFSRRQDASKKA